MIQVGISPVLWWVSLWEALIVFSDLWTPFPALLCFFLKGNPFELWGEAKGQSAVRSSGSSAQIDWKGLQTRSTADTLMYTASELFKMDTNGFKMFIFIPTEGFACPFESLV